MLETILLLQLIEIIAQNHREFRKKYVKEV